jgi:LacI family transcriptional regulator, galactose operon repressor
VRDAGLRIPQDISLIAGAESELALLNSPGISAVAWNSDQLGIAIARLMLQRIEKPANPVRRVVIPTELIQRGSSGPPSK